MSDFWVSSGHHLLDRSDGGGLVATDEFLKLFLARPELVPPPEACPVERGVHAQLLSDPRKRISEDEVALMADADARENWSLYLAFRDRLLAHATLEGAYVDLIRKGVGRTPPLFLNQLVHVILRNILDGDSDIYRWRAGEMFFRPQRMSVQDGAILLADDETIAGHEQARAASPLMAMFAGESAAQMDVLTDANAATYADRSEAFDLALDFRRDARGRHALGEMLSRWVKHLLAVEVDVTSLEKVDGDWRWFVGLDQEGTRLGNALWSGREARAEKESPPLAIYRMDFRNAADINEKIRGEPVYLILGATADRVVRLKPQNLVVGLPLAPVAHA